MANEGKATSASLGEEKISPTDPNQQAVKYNLTGVYRSKIIYNQRIKKGKVRIEQSGTEVTGKSLQSRWEFEGELEGDNIKFKWYSTANKGRGKFTVDPGGKIIGEFHGDSWGEGDWILVKEL